MEPDAAVVTDVTDSLARLVRSATLPRVTDRIAERAGIGLDRSAAGLLARLAERPCRVGELAEMLCLDVSTVSRQVHSLEESGFARREPHPTDRRGSMVVIDDQGRAALEHHRRARREIFAELLADVSQTELHTVVRLLDRLADRIDHLAGR